MLLLSIHLFNFCICANSKQILVTKNTLEYQNNESIFEWSKYYVCLLCLCLICFVYIVEEVLLFTGLSDLMGMALNRTCAWATDQQEEWCVSLELIFLCSTRSFNKKLINQNNNYNRLLGFRHEKINYCIYVGHHKAIIAIHFSLYILFCIYLHVCLSLYLFIYLSVYLSFQRWMDMHKNQLQHDNNHTNIIIQCKSMYRYMYMYM